MRSPRSSRRSDYDGEYQLERKAKRDALIPILRRKLAAELKAHPPARKRAKKAA